MRPQAQAPSRGLVQAPHELAGRLYNLLTKLLAAPLHRGGAALQAPHGQPRVDGVRVVEVLREQPQLVDQGSDPPLRGGGVAAGEGCAEAGGQGLDGFDSVRRHVPLPLRLGGAVQAPHELAGGLRREVLGGMAASEV